VLFVVNLNASRRGAKQWRVRHKGKIRLFPFYYLCRKMRCKRQRPQLSLEPRRLAGSRYFGPGNGLIATLSPCFPATGR